MWSQNFNSYWENSVLAALFSTIIVQQEVWSFSTNFKICSVCYKYILEFNRNEPKQ